MRRKLMSVMACAALLSGCSAIGVSPSPATVTVTQASHPSTTSVTTSPTGSASATSPSSQVPTDRTTTSTEPITLQAAFEKVRGGVVRIQTATCSGGGQGSGFIIAPHLVATVAHVVQDGQTVRVINGSTSVAGTVIGIDPVADVALVRTATGLRGVPLALATTPSRVGDPVAALGYTVGEPLSFKPGSVNTLDRKATIDGATRYGLLELDFAADHGNSGGPVIDTAGRVVGLVDAGTEGRQGDRLAVSASIAAPLLTGWMSSPEPPEAKKCQQAVGPDGAPHATEPGQGEASAQAFETLNIYFDSIENGDYPTAVAQLAQPMSVKLFRDGVKSTHNSGFEVKSVTVASGGEPVVWLTFVSNQQAGDGPKARPQERCTNWSLDYHFRRVNGLWLIRSVRQHEAEPMTQSCDSTP